MRNVVLCMLAVSLFCMSCSKSEIKNEKFTIIYSGNIGGQVNPCGCQPPMGGYARKSTIINAVRSEKEKNILVLDSGALLFNSIFLQPSTEALSKLNAHVAAQIVDKLGFDAINVSSFDLSNSVDSLLAIDRSSSVNWLSSNLVWRDSGEPVFTKDIILSKGILNIGIFGVMADDFLGANLYDESSPLKVLDIIETAKEEVSKLKAETDIIIALCYISEKEATELCEKVSGIDIVIHSHNGYHDAESYTETFKPEKINKKLFLQCPDGGRVLGVIDLEVVNGSGDFKEVEGKTVINKKSDDIIDYAGETDSKYQNYFFTLTDDINTDTEIQEEIDRLREGLSALRDSLGLD
ncbi:hypothetical protein ACFL6H_08995 [Candidatus Latescibacterota bacterium]